MTVAVEHAWSEIREALQTAVDERTFALWLAPLEVQSLEGQRLHLCGPPEVARWASSRLEGVLQGCAAAVLGSGATVTVHAGRREPVAVGRPADRASGPSEPPQSPLNPKFTFEQFVIGRSNRLAHSAALAVAELPGQVFNPLFIHGPPGLGKTHLLHSIGNYVTNFGGGLRVRYATLESYTNDFLASLAAGTMEAFKRRYRALDVLLLDDVQFIEGKERTEEELFHTFTALCDSGAQVVLTSDRAPAELRRLTDRLRERFEAGLATGIGRPERGTRDTILRMRARRDAIDADPEALALIAATVDANVRALEGALIRVVAYASLTARRLDAALVREVLGRVGPNQAPRAAPRLEDVQAAACAHFGIERDDLLGRTRSDRLDWPRQAAMFLARELTSHSLPAIGEAFRRDHSTVLHAVKRAAVRIGADASAYRDVDVLTDLLKGVDR